MSFVRAPTAVVSAILAGICAILLLALTLLTTGSVGKSDAPALVRPTLAAPELPTLTSLPDRERASADKPLFHPDRNPHRAAADTSAASAAETATVAPFRLKGVVMANGMARASLMRDVEGDIEWVNRGSEIDGWTLESVRSDRVVLSRGEYRTTLLLYPDR